MHGAEPLLVEELAARVAARILAGSEAAAWNREVLHADTSTPDAIVAAGLALPLFGERALVLVRGLGGLAAKAMDRLRT
ncbi:MAG: hypothetical protein ACREMB_13190, partial [Candidatus Rokuibacteriota bacterium]